MNAFGNKKELMPSGLVTPLATLPRTSSLLTSKFSRDDFDGWMMLLARYIYF